ncbi:MAG: hypothetical protein DMF61_22135 [Blastocatellia bacterium AA13]|nr:MAG: hypothetical protein DMF61_22135 [Blastocatellia bacterium AA13]
MDVAGERQNPLSGGPASGVINDIRCQWNRSRPGIVAESNPRTLIMRGPDKSVPGDILDGAAFCTRAK